MTTRTVTAAPVVVTLTVMCPTCNEYHDPDELMNAVFDTDNVKVCQSCIDQHYTMCDGCQRYIHTDEIHQGIGSPDYCDHCYRQTPDYIVEHLQALEDEAAERKFDEWRENGGRWI